MRRNSPTRQCRKTVGWIPPFRGLIAAMILLVPFSVSASPLVPSASTEGRTLSRWQGAEEAQRLIMPVTGNAKSRSERICRFNNRSYTGGATIRCSMDPNLAQGCALGLPFAEWSCRDGRWVLSRPQR